MVVLPNMPYKAPNGFVYESRKAYLRSLKKLHAMSSFEKPISSKRSKKKAKRMRQRVELSDIKYQKVLPNNVGTASNRENFKVVDSWDSKENRRKFQNNVIHIRDEDTNVEITLIDRENKLKPKRAKNIITEEYQGDSVVTEYDNTGKKVAELHVQYNNINPIDLDRTPKRLQEISKDFEKDIDTLDTAQVKSLYDLALLRTLGQEVYKTGKPKKAQKDEKLWYIRAIRKAREKPKEEPKKESKNEPKEEIKFGDITKIKKWSEK